MHTSSRWLCCAAFVMVFLTAVSAHGACLPAGTSGDDTIVCTGTDVAGVGSGEGNDAITVQPGATVAVTDRQDPGGAPADAAARAIDAGAGEDSVVNHGSAAASAVAVSGGNNPLASATGLGIGAGIPWFAGGGGLWQDTLRDTIQSAGTLSVRADSTASASVTGVLGNTTGASTADAAGIRTGQRGADIVNTGSLDVLGRAQAHVYEAADSTHETDAASSYATTVATAVGIDAAGGDNRVRNEGSLRVDAVVQDAFAHAEAWSSSTDATSYAEARATATATGISTGAGRDDIRNAGRLTVIADTDAVAEALAQAPTGNVRYETANVSSIARATGIDAGAGPSVIHNDGTLDVRAMATARASTFGGIGGFSIAFGATATGIKVGDGGSEIRNTGTIDVLAAGRAHGASNAIAVGILGGNGDDTIVNEGTIFTGIVSDPAVLRALVSAGQSGMTITAGIRHGVAISGGGGNDGVTLTGASQTVGNIDLGDGNDRLTIMGPASVTGGIQAGAGTDTLVIDGAGSLGSAPLGFEQAAKQGLGTYTLPGLASLQRLTVQEGTLRLTSSYGFAPTGTFQAAVYGDGRHGQLAVAGTATLAGTLQVLRGPGTYRNGTTYAVVVADAVTDWFTNIALPAPTNLVSFRVNGTSDQVQVEAVVQPSTAVATNATHQRIARHLDGIMPTVTGDLADVLAEFQALPASGFPRAFASLGPMIYDSLTQAAVGSARPYTQSLQRRLDTVRALYRTGGDGAPAGPVLLAAAGDPSLVPILGTYRLAPTQAKQGLWASGFGQWDDQETTPGFTGFTARTGGFTVGYDYTFGDHLTTGLSLGYADTDVDLAADQGGGRVQGVFPALYASYFTPTAYVESALSYGHNWYKNQRQLVVGGIERIAQSEHEGNGFAAYLGAGYAYPIGDWAVGPVGALQYVYLAEQGFQETGAGSLNLSVASRDTNALVSELGVRVNGRVKTAVGTLVPDLSLVWRYDFDLDDRVITTTYAGAPGAAFSIAGQPTSRNGVVVRPGLTFVHPAGVSTTLRYAGQFQNDFQSHAVVGEVRVQF